jgi:hypothetical protein
MNLNQTRDFICTKRIYKEQHYKLIEDYEY